MSKANRRITAIVIACLAAGLVIVGQARAADPDPLKQAAALQKIEAEQTERDVRDACDEAVTTARTQPSEAIKRLQGQLLKVDAYEHFSAEKKEVLTALLKRTLTQVQKIADGASDANVGTGFHPVLHDARTEEQKKLVSDAVDRIMKSKDALAESADVRRRKSEAIAGLFHGIEAADIPDDRPFVLPSNWEELSKRRLKNNTVTETERAILKALAATVSVDFKDQHFGGVVEWFQHQMGQTIILDKAALDDIGVNNESSINVTLNKVTTRTALKKVLADLGLTYVIKEEAIFVTTPAKAKDMMTVRTYYIGDLMGQYDVRFGGALSQYRRWPPWPSWSRRFRTISTRTAGRPTARTAAAPSSSTRST